MQMHKYEVTVKDRSEKVNDVPVVLGGYRATEVSATVKKTH